ncbi:MAG: CehA/McbA family metallohydrolase [Pirellulaceae bacterium]|nr:CehA/McbA family metallohydrolase [Pirellulaceae bacterium]
MRTLSLLFACLFSTVATADLPQVTSVESQPLKSQVSRLIRALEFLGQPLNQADQQQLQEALEQSDEVAVPALQAVLDQQCIAGVHINPESRVKIARGPATAELMEQGWRVFLVKIHNEAGVTAPLRVASPNAAPLYQQSTGKAAPTPSILPTDVPNRWLDVEMYTERPLLKTLSGLELEYQIVQLYSRDHGKREAILSFDVGQGTQDLGFRNQVPILFECQPAVKVRLEIVDDDGTTTTTGQFVIRDKDGRVYPSRARRLAPDFFFHDQIYRHHGEHVLLPPGDYEVTYTRGPEYQILTREIHVNAVKEQTESFRLRRWIRLTDHGWYSGDHHIHAAGCSHYEAPTQGVTPEAMMRHIMGEDLNVGCVLSWGPCWYHQKQFFDGKVHTLSNNRYLMRYDVEVSGFPSSHCGHLCLLRLSEDDYPGTTKIEEWPSWDLPVLKWGKEQGGVVGFSHSGWGMEVPGDELPSYEMPRFDGIGANEYVVDVVHDVCDFISSVDTPIVWELSVWYHTLNCGYTCRISGETDFPCIYGERVGLGRVYVKLPQQEQLDYDQWVMGLRDGRSYCGDGLSHLFNFRINNLAVGEIGDDARPSFLQAKSGDELTISVSSAAKLAEKARDDIRNRPLSAQPYWHVERARIGNSNKVPVELIVNGEVVERREITGDGSIQDLQFSYRPTRSCWVAMRIFPTVHTNPIFVEVDHQPIRASKRSAQWCLDAVDVCWEQKSPRIRESEQGEAAQAFEEAREAYRKILAESHDDR